MFARDQPPGCSWAWTRGRTLRKFLKVAVLVSTLGLIACSPSSAEDTKILAAGEASLSPTGGSPATVVSGPAYSDGNARAIGAAVEASRVADAASQPPSASLHRSRYTKAEFNNYAYGMTKAQIRAEFGSPLVVHDDGSRWYFPNLPVYDADAGIQVPVTLGFMRIGGLEDEVATVEY